MILSALCRNYKLACPLPALESRKSELSSSFHDYLRITNLIMYGCNRHTAELFEGSQSRQIQHLRLCKE